MNEYPTRVLQLKNIESLGVYDALISKVKMINKHVHEFNRRCQVHWCEGHRTTLVSNDGLKQSEAHMMKHTVCIKLHNLVASVQNLKTSSSESKNKLKKLTNLKIREL